MKYNLEMTINYPESEEDTPSEQHDSTISLLRSINAALQSVTATSFVFTVSKSND